MTPDPDVQIVSLIIREDEKNASYMRDYNDTAERILSALRERGYVKIPTHDDLAARNSALESSLRDCLHLLDTAEGLWVSDKPASHTGMLDIGIDGILPWATRSDGDAMWVAPGLYWQQTFRDTDAVKRARELVEQCPSAFSGAAHSPQGS